MYDIKQFKPALYVLLIIGMTGFAMAAQSPGLWLLGTGGVVLNAWLVFTGRFSPLPRWLANIITLLLFAFAAMQLRYGMNTPILVIGQFLVLLQVIKLFEQRANRDYAQLLVLSLLLMVAASINTASLLFAVLLVSYLFLSLYCCLLFHLKVETDQARAQLSIPEEKINPATLRQDQRYLTRSMRRLTGMVSLVAISMAVAVFILFPRGTGAGLLGPLQVRPNQSLTGFSEEVSFQQVASITQSHDPVATVEVMRDGQTVRGGVLLLRGLTLDSYRDRRWSRSRAVDDWEVMVPAYSAQTLRAPEGDLWVQRIRLEPAGTTALFALPGVHTIRSMGAVVDIRYSPRDNTLQLLDRPTSRVIYEVTSNNADLIPASRMRGRRATRSSDIAPEIAAYARRSEVTGDLPTRRGEQPGPHELDEEIARRIEKHFQTQFSYSLDLTDARGLQRGEDPLVWFLSDDGRRGHCEYFAGAMALMCQSLGMEARVVVGFKCDEFNPYGNFFQVRQSHAHAWVEVLTPNGWMTFDPTSGNEAPPASALQDGWHKLRQLLGYMEYTWANSVVAYDQESRQHLIANIDMRVMTSVNRSQRWIDRMVGWVTFARYSIVSRVLGTLVALGIAGLLVAIGWFLYERWQIRRRVARIGLDTLPASDQTRLARQLAFYDELMQMLERCGHVRPRHQTPMEFCRSLVFLPPGPYDVIGRMTDLFYRVRYGQLELSRIQRRRLRNMIHRLEERLPESSGSRGSL